KDAIASVVIDLVLADFNTRRTAAGVSSANAIATISGDHAVPHADSGNTSRGISKYTVGRVVGEVAVICSYTARLPGVDAVSITGQAHSVERSLHSSAGTESVNAVQRVVPDDGVSDIQV